MIYSDTSSCRSIKCKVRHAITLTLSTLTRLLSKPNVHRTHFLEFQLANIPKITACSHFIVEIGFRLQITRISFIRTQTTAEIFVVNNWNPLWCSKVRNVHTALLKLGYRKSHTTGLNFHARLSISGSKVAYWKLYSLSLFINAILEAKKHKTTKQRHSLKFINVHFVFSLCILNHYLGFTEKLLRYCI